MKQTSQIKALLNKRGINVTLGLCMGAMLLFTGGCHKSEKPKPTTQTSSPHVLNHQEQALLGTWDLMRKETYEVNGIDSIGNCQCSLIGTAPGDSTCAISFFSSIMGAGSIGGCDPNAAFSWNVSQQNKLQTSNGLYQIEYLNKDSMALSTVYVKDILELKDIFYYRKK